MAGEEPSDPVTVELAAQDRGATLERPELDDQLPGLEPDRRVTDWGRSERVERVIDSVLYEFLYRYWFRVDVEGIENVPAQGAALLVANHAGAIPPDGAMIAKAIREEHSRPRPLHVTTVGGLTDLPMLGMLITKLGGVPAHPANIHRLLFDEHQLVLVFPEGRRGSSKSLKERYRLRRFGDGAFVSDAIRAGAPIVPVAVLGAEEAAPIFAHINPLRRITGLPIIPLTPAIPLPAKFVIRFLEPVPTDEVPPTDASDHGLVQSLAHDIRALIQENLFEMVSRRRSVWLG